jgi:hypothetical protein
METNKSINAINSFQSVYDKYFKALTEYMMGEFGEEHEYKFSHPTLFELSIQLKAEFYSMPEELRNRLLTLNFETFLHCNNQVDFFSFRIFLSKKNRFEKLATIAERVDAEVKTAIQFLEKDIFHEYEKLPVINHNFYRDYYINTDLFSESENEKQEDRTDVSMLEPKDPEGEPSNEDKIESKNLFTEYNESLKKGEELLSNTNNFVDKLKYSVVILKEFFKLFN